MNLTFTFDSFIKEVSVAEKYKKFLDKSAIEYDIKTHKIRKLTPCQIKSIKKKIYESHQLTKKEEKLFLNNNNSIWQMNQLKFFVWVIVCYANLMQKHIQYFTQNDWNFFMAVIPTKSIDSLKYESLKLYKLKQPRTRWTKDQDELLVSIITNLEMEKHWNEVSKLLYFKSQKKYFKHPRRCRERWYNHLDRTVKRVGWTLEQDLLLFQQVYNIGTKWAQISKSFMGKRTEHMIKNRFKSRIRKMQKLHVYSCEENLILKIIENINKQIIKQNKIKNIKIKQRLNDDSAQFYSPQKKQEYLAQKQEFQHQEDMEANLSYFTGSTEIQMQIQQEEQMIQIDQDYIKINTINSVSSDDLFEQLGQMQLNMFQCCNF